MSVEGHNGKAKRLPWWAIFAMFFIPLAMFRLLTSYLPPLSDSARETIIAAAAIFIAGLLTYSIYRFVRM